MADRTYTFDQLNANPSTNTSDGLRNVANTAADFACDLYQNYAQAATGFGDPTGIGTALNAIYSSLCSPRGKTPPAPPTAPFNGGQCLGASYRVTTSVTKPDGSSYTTLWPSLNGPIKGVQIKQEAGGAWVYGVVSSGIGPLAGDVMNIEVSSNNRQGLDGYVVQILSITRNGGLPDNCGDPAASYPQKPAPTTATNKNTNVNVGAGAIVAVPVTIIPVVNKANVAINPQIQVDVGPFNVTFDAGGVTLAPNFKFNTDTTTPTGNNGVQSQPSKTANNTTTTCDLTPVTTRLDNISGRLTGIESDLDDIENCACPVKYTVTTNALGTGDSGVAVLPSNTTQVSLNLTEIPDNAKIQSGGSAAPNYYFCGYYSFGNGTGFGSRQAISTAQSVFEVPVWATSFQWTLYPGYSASVSCTTLVPDKANSELAVRQMKQKPA